MSIFIWNFHTIPDPREVEDFIDALMPLFSRNARHLRGADGEPVVDLMRVEHNCGTINLEFQLNGVEGQSGDVFCFPGYYPGDMDDAGNLLFNYCDTQGHFYGKIVEKILVRARNLFDMEITINVNEQWQLHPAG
ncbi:MAG TPA: hypothetical protein VFO91_19330 [Anaerolineales bacterium]|nr:hypothetical protein [Anaerolineales bacterium]